MSEVKPGNSWIDPSLNPANSENYALSIRVSPDGFVFATLDNRTKKFIAIEDYNFETPTVHAGFLPDFQFIRRLNKIISGQPLLQAGFEKVVVSVGSLPYTLMPTSLFDPEQRRTYLEFNHRLAENSHVYHLLASAPDQIVVFSIPGALDNWILNTWPGALRVPVPTTLIRCLTSMVKNYQAEFGNKCFLNIRRTSFDLLIFKHNQLIYCNSFEFATPVDLLYYVLFVLESLGMESQRTVLSLTGAVDAGDEIHSLLVTQMEHVRMTPANNYFAYSHEIPAGLLHRYYDLFNAAL